jgi:hypothetical protein
MQEQQTTSGDAQARQVMFLFIKGAECYAKSSFRPLWLLLMRCTLYAAWLSWAYI